MTTAMVRTLQWSMVVAVATVLLALGGGAAILLLRALGLL